jgi:GNAT superfamily N-acetyltransferase
MALLIRKATAADAPQILAFIHALAEYEKAPDAVEATVADLVREGFGPTPRFHCLLAESDDQPAGYALYFHTYSTWTGHPGLHLEDLFVLPEFRGKGVGKALIAAVAARARAEDCRRLEWAVLDWNQPAIDFYRSLGGEFLDEWRTVRLTGPALETLATRQTAEEKQ